MPKEGDEKPCSVTGCSGTMVYQERYVPPGGNTSFSGKGGAAQFIDPHAAWVCNKDEHHEEGPLKQEPP